MGKINRLDEHLSNMIAAGEVVERPTGIVKELIENCIDAHAKNIKVQIVQGGIDTITIIDDGDGMDAGDATLAFERHATSKLQEVNDLWNIHTMGFRGEALPSIASVSHVVLRTNNGVEATEVEINYGKLQHARPCASPKGTMIEVKNLFQKTPARFKHLKSPQYEFSLIHDVAQKFALSYPEIGFHVSHDGKSIFKTRGNGSLLEVLMNIYGRESAKSAIALQGKDQDYQIGGYIMQPQYNRATKYYMQLYVNNRMIRNYHLQKAITDAYAPYLPKDRYPIVVVHLQMDAQLVDVNVHPSKWEIRLSKEKQLEKLLYETIQHALSQKTQIVELKKTEKKEEKIELQKFDFVYQKEDTFSAMHKAVNDSFVNPEKNISPASTSNEKIVEVTTPPVIKPEQTSEDEDVNDKQILNIAEDQGTYESINSVEKEPDNCDKTIPLENVEEDKEDLPVNKHPGLPQLQVIGQLHNCYIIAQGEKGLYIIDQHAAQERYHYEVIKKQIMSGLKETQPLLIPISIDCKQSLISRITELNAILGLLGLQLEMFGEHTMICRELPIWMTDTDEKAFVQDMIDFFERDDNIDIEKLRKHAVATMACHSSIRFHRTLTMQEMQQVIFDLEKCEQPFHCPHGRPTLICVSDDDLFKQFERG